MGKNLNTPKSMDRAASDSTPGGTKVMNPEPSGGKVRNISGPSISGPTTGGNKVNNTGIDNRTTVESP